MQDFRNLLVWQKAHQLALQTYRITNDFPRDEVFGLRNMMRKIAIDIPGYIAEGAAKPNDVEFGRSISVALAFGNRLEYYALMAHDLEFIATDAYTDYQADLLEVKRLMGGFGRKLSS